MKKLLPHLLLALLVVVSCEKEREKKIKNTADENGNYIEVGVSSKYCTCEVEVLY